MSDQLEKLLAQEPMKKPAKGWRNWFRATVAFKTIDGAYDAGDVHHGTRVWPSKDAAESHVKFDHSPRYKLHRASTEYLGAYPDGERP